MKQKLQWLIIALTLNCFFSNNLFSQFRWEQPQANVDPSGDLTWNPTAFTFDDKGNQIRYIDYETGDDNNSGTSTSEPWQHHPWDNNATGNAASSSGSITYVFKRGVIYRGQLVADESGTADNPIVLTSSPSWGTGEAMIFGAERHTSGWSQGDAGSCPGIPNPTEVYYKDLPLSYFPNNISYHYPDLVCEVDNNGEVIKNIPLARIPNWTITNRNDPMSNWYEFDGKTTVNSNIVCIDNDGIVATATDPNALDGAILWGEWGEGTGGAANMGTMCVNANDLNFDPATNTISGVVTTSGAGNRYFLERHPSFLDENGEFYYDVSLERFFIRMPDGGNPNGRNVEIANKRDLIFVRGYDHIEISALTFKFNLTRIDIFSPQVNEGSYPIHLREGCSFINIHHNKFIHLNSGIMIAGDNISGTMTETIIVADNEFTHLYNPAVQAWVWSEYTVNRWSEIYDVQVLRNKLYDIGSRNKGRNYADITAIDLSIVQTCEIAGNIIEYAWGGGISVSMGKGSGQGSETAELIRGLIYNNKVDTCLLVTNDWGGIESWQGGPVYIFNNISRNTRGFRHQAGNSSDIYCPWGGFYYLDGANKNYVFNNLAVGLHNNLAEQSEQHCQGFMMVHGIDHAWVNNTAYKLTRASQSVGHMLNIHFLGNVFEDISHSYHRHAVDYKSALSNNVYYGSPIAFASDGNTFANYQSFLASSGLMLSSVGVESASSILESPESGDFTPASGSDAIDFGVRYFVPWSLAKTVGEWLFTKQSNPGLIHSENWYMTTDYNNRENYDDVYVNELTAHNITGTDYVYGDLEDWVEGAIEFNGTDQYCDVAHSQTSTTICRDMDVGTGSFIVEAYMKTEVGRTNDAIAGKCANGSNGYLLEVDNAGSARLRILTIGADAAFCASSKLVNDGDWHHILAEVDKDNDSIRIYIDGLLDGGVAYSVSDNLDNGANFTVGNDFGNNYFMGQIDFVRVAKSTLAESRTTLEELYKWEIDGPMYRDFAGAIPQGTRDAGAIELGGIVCNLTTSIPSLNIDKEAQDEKIIITSNDTWTATVNVGWITLTTYVDSISVSIDENTNEDARQGIITIDGCSRKTINVSQEGTCSLIPSTSLINFIYTGGSSDVTITSTDAWTATPSDSWINTSINGDDITVTVGENTTGSARSGSISLSGCTEKSINISQSAACDVMLSSDTLNFEMSFSTQSIIITSSESVSVSEDENWITTNLNGTTLEVSVTTNNGSVTRTGEITITGCQTRTLTIIQIRTFAIIARASAGGTATGTGYYDIGEQVTLNATPGAGFVFVHWLENSNVVSTSATYTFTANDDRDIEAVFRDENAVDIANSNSNGIIIFPNPASSIVTFSNIQPDSKIQLLNSFGQLVKHALVENETYQMNLNEVESGIYILSIKQKNGITEKKRLIVQ